MKFEILQTRQFANSKKKLPTKQLIELDHAVHEIMSNPLSGELKKGDLAQVRVHKFKINKQLYLLSYTVENKVITFISLGSHENFYRDLKKILH